jgi:hypothetical protein
MRQILPVQQLIHDIEEVIVLLERHQHHHWATWMRCATERLIIGERSAIGYLLQAYSGCGTFHDLTLPDADGVRLCELREAIYTLARTLRRQRSHQHSYDETLFS